ncbi:MAG: prepilin-type N-terminal cleavage/methylation domain-containing protein [Sandaracinaceae bacterium]|nr:prepilin-type N-terminal cleavage/methylation domain-containing protein [Sandaracinaceae bacterium]
MRRSQTRRGEAGFTLVEALAVVAVIAIGTALAAPAAMSAMANRRATEAAHAVVRIGARGRSEAIGYGRAHVMTFTEDSSGPGGNHGRLELWRGRADRCSANDWATIITGTCAGNPSCIESLDMGAYAYPTHRVRLRLEGANAGAICFQPNGDNFYAGAGGLWGTNPPAGIDAVQFRVQRLLENTPEGVDRFVVFPFGAGPRIRR